jgi:citrate synthase
MNRQKSILSTRRMAEEIPEFVKDGHLVPGKSHGFASAVFHTLTGAAPRSEITSAFTEAVFTLLIDHGGHVSGAVNTMITARAGKDMVSSLSAGLLTVGPRFGGAINSAAGTWLTAVAANEAPMAFVERKNKAGELILGIGHRKYRVGVPDPRVEALSAFASLLKKHPHYDFAREVEKITTAKNGNLILNVDGLVAALLLDILTECEGYSNDALKELVDAEFFNAFFVIPRAAGFAGHFIEQKKNDEGLFRLPDELLFEREEDAA